MQFDDWKEIAYIGHWNFIEFIFVFMNREGKD